MPVSQCLPSSGRPSPDAPPVEESSADDLSALRLVTVPDWGPPFDDELTARQAAASAAGPWQAACGLADLGPGADGYSRDRAGVRTPGKPNPGAMTHTAGAQLPEPPGEWPRQFARLLAEALAGARPVRQILPWTSERARVHVRQLMPLFGGGLRPRVLRVITTRPTITVIEMTVIVGVGARTRALAVRLEQAAPRRLPGPGEHATRPARPAESRPRWLCTDIEAA